MLIVNEVLLNYPRHGPRTQLRQIPGSLFFCFVLLVQLSGLTQAGLDDLSPRVRLKAYES